jgi:hypothetical protein
VRPSLAERRARKRAIGFVQFVQEQRFRLRTQAGTSFVPTLAQDARIAAAELGRFRVEQRLVEFDYAGEAGLTSGVAHAVRPVS